MTETAVLALGIQITCQLLTFTCTHTVIHSCSSYCTCIL